MTTIISALIGLFVLWNERAKVAAAVKKISAITPGLPGRVGPEVSRKEAVDAVEVLLQYARERESSGGVEEAALKAGRAIWDCEVMQ